MCRRNSFLWRALRRILTGRPILRPVAIREWARRQVPLGYEQLEQRQLLSATISNIQISDSAFGSVWSPDGRYLAFGVSEFNEGDLNNDGDTDDRIAHILDSETSAVLNLEIEVDEFFWSPNSETVIIDNFLQDSQAYDVQSDSLQDLGVGGSVRWSEDGRWASLSVWEDDDGVDLNTDGDTDDRVLHVFDTDSGQVRNLGVDHASYGWSPGSHHLAIVVDEAGQGNTPLNGDGDANDGVLHVYNSLSQNLVNVGLVVSEFWEWSPAGGRLVFGVDEIEQGDPNLLIGNPPSHTPVVVHVYDASSETTRNLEVEQWTFAWSPDGTDLAVGAQETFVQIDINNDGDTHDDVLHIYHADSGAFTKHNVDSGDFQWSPDSERLAFRASEWQWMDLNGDMDTNDSVLHLVNPDNGAITNLKVNARVPDNGWSPDGLYFAAAVWEKGQGIDFNDDGDLFDHPVNIYDTVSGILTSTELPRSGAESEWNASSTAFALSASESSHSADLNSDGDQSDAVLHISSAGGGLVTNLHLAVDQWEWSPAGRFLAFQVDEAYQGEDLNQDGDTDDLVLHVYDHDHALVTNLELDGSKGWEWSPNGRQLAFRVDEGDQGSDLNSDSDTDDDVLHFYDPVARTVDNTGLPALSNFQDQWNATSELFKFLVPEADAGVDLNGDGDAFDAVVHVAQFEPVSNQPPQAQADAFDADEIAGVFGNVLADNGHGPDSDPDGDALSVVSVEGQVITPGETKLITLASGARVRVSSDGQFTYDPNGAFDLGPGETALEHFSYTIRDAADATSTAQVSITVRNSALTITGNTARFSGTTGDDVFVYRVDNRLARINGLAFIVPSHVTLVEFDGLDGNDSLNLIGTPSGDSALTRPGQVFLDHDNSHAGFDVTGVSIENVILDGNGGTDTVTMRDSVGDDKLFARPSSAVLFASDLSYVTNVFGFSITTLFIDGNDFARFTDSASDEIVIARPGNASLVSGGLVQNVQNFDTLLARSLNGNDIANVFGTADVDFFTGRNGFAALTSGGMDLLFDSFETVNTNGLGGDDLVRFLGGPQDDLLVAGPNAASFTTGVSVLNTTSFERLIGTAGAGANDRAILSGTPGTDGFVGSANFGELTGPGFFLRTFNFDRITINGLAGLNTFTDNGINYVLIQQGTWV